RARRVLHLQRAGELHPAHRRHHRPRLHGLPWWCHERRHPQRVRHRGWAGGAHHVVVRHPVHDLSGRRHRVRGPARARHRAACHEGRLTMQGLLGCGTHTASVWDRDGQKLLDLDDIRFAQYSGELDTHSDATVTVGRGGACCSMLGMVRPWRHNLVIYRTAPGQPQHEVWSGPIIEPEFGRDETTIYARDAWAWLDRRDIRETVTASGDLSDVGWVLIDHGLTHPDGGLDETGIRRHLDKRAAGVPGAREWEDD